MPPKPIWKCPRCLFPTRQEGVVRFYVGIRVCDASAPRPHPVSRKSLQVSRQSSSPVDPAKYPARAARQSIPPAARQWIPPSIPPERLASGSRRVSHQSSPPVDPAEYRAEHPRSQNSSPINPAEYPARVARQWIPPSIPSEQLASGSRPSIPLSIPVDPAKYPARAIACQWTYPTNPAEYPRGARQWILPSIAPD